MTSIRKSVQRITHEDDIYDQGKRRKIIARLGPGDLITFRLRGRHKSSFTDGLTIKELFWIALKRTVQRQWEEKNKKRKELGKRLLKRPSLLRK